MSRLVLFRGGGEMASAAARLLFLAGFRVALLERQFPLAVRRLVCFAEAVLSGEVTVEGVRARRVALDALPAALADTGFVPVAVDPEGQAIGRLLPTAVVDARMAKTKLDTRRQQAPLVVGLGPGFVAGEDVHVVVETQRGATLGRLIWSGAAEADTAVPSLVLGVGEGRVLRAPCSGRFRGRRGIGELVAAGDTIGEVDGEPVRAQIAGLLRGVVADAVPVEAHAKLGDIDPRGFTVDAALISDKARAVAAGVLEALLLGTGPAGRPETLP